MENNNQERYAKTHIEDSESVSGRYVDLHNVTTLAITTLQGASVRRSDDGQWFSLTDMFKASKKSVGNYLRNEGTKRFLAKLALYLGLTVDDLLIVNKGGNAFTQGTWLHRRAIMHGLSECSDDVKVWFFGEIGYQLLSGQDIKNSDAMASLKQTTDILSQPEVKELVASYESQMDKLIQDNERLEALTDELATDLALKDHKLNQMQYFVKEADVLGRWQQENSWS